MRTTRIRGAASLLMGLSLSQALYFGHLPADTAPDARGPEAVAVAHAVSAHAVSADHVVGGQAIDWTVCGVSAVLAGFIPVVGWAALLSCFSAVVRTAN